MGFFRHIYLIQRRAPPSSRQHRLFRFVWTAHAVIRVASVELRTFVLLPREVRVVLNDQGLFSPDHLKSLLSWALVLKFVHIQITPRSPLGRRDMPQSGRPDQNHSGGAWSAT